MQVQVLLHEQRPHRRPPVLRQPLRRLRLSHPRVASSVHRVKNSFLMGRNSPSLGTCPGLSADFCSRRVRSANSYWVGLGGLTTTDIAQAFSDVAGAGGTVVRTWYVLFMLSFPRILILHRGFNEVTSKPWNAYYQIWNGNTPTINTGADGLGSFGQFLSESFPSRLRRIRQRRLCCKGERHQTDCCSVRLAAALCSIRAHILTI